MVSIYSNPLLAALGANLTHQKWLIRYSNAINLFSLCFPLFKTISYFYIVNRTVLYSTLILLAKITEAVFSKKMWSGFVNDNHTPMPPYSPTLVRLEVPFCFFRIHRQINMEMETWNHPTPSPLKDRTLKTIISSTTTVCVALIGIPIVQSRLVL